ncbi:MAG: site-specific DNA-methyltransferase [Caldilineaceae bacterium]|nr:site-specific DNA-methyltransferase [Caldilineaceae bacterium]
MTVSLSWPGKRPPVTPQPAALTLCETFEPDRLTVATGHGPANALYHGDNLPILATLAAGELRGRVRLIYADPPYNSGVDWAQRLRRRGPKQPGVDNTIGRQMQYADTWDAGAYLQFVYDRLPICRDLLADDGTFWLHCDHRHAHHLRCLLDEVFGAENHLNTITWRSQTPRGAKANAFYFANSGQSIQVYARNRATPPVWNAPKKRIVLSEAEAAVSFMRDERGFFRTSDPGTYSFGSLARLHADGRLYAPFGGEIVVDDARQRIYCSNGGNIGVKYYLTALDDGRFAVERAVDNVWDDIPGLGTTPGEDLGYPTQKTAALLERIIATGTRPGDWVLDPFCGSGTTLAVAQRLGRRWQGIDAAPGAVATTVRRMHAVCTEAAAGSAAFAVYACAGAPADAPGLPPITAAITRIAGAAATIRVTLAPAAAETGGDWRAWVEAVAIDPDYDGAVLRVALADAPLKRAATVTGVYELPAPPAPTTVAVRVLEITGAVHLITGTV